MEVFKVGVEFLFDSNALGFFPTLSGHLLGLNKHLIESQHRIDGMARAIKGLAIAAGGVKALKFEFGLAQHGADLNHQLALLRRQGGVSQSDVHEALGAAYRQAAATPGAGSVSDEVGLIRELRSQMPSMHQALQILPFFAKLREVMAAYSPDGRVSDRELLDGLKAIETRGHGFTEDPKTGQLIINPQAFTQEGDALQRAIIASGGLFTPTDARNMVRQAGPAARGMTADAFYGQAAEMAVIMGSSKAGTAMLSLFNQLAMGTMTNKVLGRLIDAHLVNPHFVKFDAKGHPKEMLPGAVVDSKLLYTNFIAWMKEAYGILKKQHPHDSQQQLFIAFEALFGRQTTQRLAAEAVQAAPEFENKLKQYRATAGTNSNAQFLQQHDYKTVLAGFENSWETLLESLGSPLLKPVSQMLVSLTNAFNDMAQFVNKNPTLVTTAAKIVATISAFAVVVGGAVFLAAMAELAGDFAAIAGVITGVAVGLELLISYFGQIDSWLKSLGQWIPDSKRLAIPSPHDHGAISTPNQTYLFPGAYEYNPASPHQHVAVYLDGEQISARVERRMTQHLNQQQTGVSGFDTSMNQPYLGPAHAI